MQIWMNIFIFTYVTNLSYMTTNFFNGLEKWSLDVLIEITDK